jgi:hypothetical protein
MPTNDLAAVVTDWPAAWQQPGLFALGLTDVGATAAAAAEAVLDGLLEPVADAAEGVQRLIDAREFRAARALLQRLGSALAQEQRTELDERVTRAVTAARTALQPRAHQLATQAGALGSDTDPGYWSLLVQDSGREAEQALDEWRERLDADAAKRRSDIEKHVAGLHHEQAAIVQACLDSGEYDVAERVATQSDFEPAWAVPAGVSRPDRWYYPQPDRTIVQWFLTKAPAPADFGRHRPTDSDEPAWALLNALHGAHDGLDNTTARALADAFGHLVQDAAALLRLRPDGDGFTVEVSCFADSRLPRLKLSGPTTLHIGPQPPAPGAEPRLWLPTSDARSGPPAGVAVIEPHLLFSLLEPNGEGHAPSTSWRRMNVLRHLCAQLPFDRVVSLTDQDLGDEAALRTTLLWLFDLLGLQAAPEVADMVLYYTAAVPSALEAMLRELSRAPRPRPLTHQDLSDFRDDPEATRAVRTAVLAPLKDDLSAQVVHGALLGRAAGTGTDRVDREELCAELEALTMLLMEEYEREGGRTPNLPLERIDVDSALERIENAFLAEVGDDGVLLPGPGLVSLLSGDETTANAVRALRRLHESLDKAEELARLLLMKRTKRQNEHVKAGFQYAVQQLGARMEAVGDPVQRSGLRRQISALEELVDDCEAIENNNVEYAVRTTTFDFVGLARSIAQTHTLAGQAEAEVVDRTGGDGQVTARRLLVQLTLNDLVINATQAMEAAKSPRKAVRVTVGHRDTVTERFLIADIEDSGPGFGKADRTALDGVRKASGMPGGEGLRLAQENLEACRGKLERLAQPSAALGGAHLRIWLPRDS